MFFIAVVFQLRIPIVLAEIGLFIGAPQEAGLLQKPEVP